MGILHLTSYISPYAVTTVLGCDKPACSKHSSLVTSRSKVVIDGPAFAYEVYNRLTAFKVDRSDALAVVPSYDEVGRAALAYLAGLEKHSIIMYGQVKPIFMSYTRNSADRIFDAVTRSTLMDFYRPRKRKLE